MAYDDTTYRRPADEPSDPAAYRANGYSPSDYRNRRRDLDPENAGAAVARMSAEPLRRLPVTEVPGRDRLGIHIGWEIVLLLAAAAVGFLLHNLDPAALRRPALDTLLISGTTIGLLALGAGLSLRVGVPNLAVGPIALAGALHYAENGDRGLLAAALPAVLIAAGGGLVVALLVIGLHVPGWAATLGGATGVIVFDQLRTAPVDVQGSFDLSDQAFFLFGGFAVLAVAGGALGTVAPVRRMLGQLRPTGDPAVRRGAAAALPVLVALVLSSVFAVVAGMLMAAQSAGPIVPGTGLEWTAVAIGVALFGGTSAFGRRGGVFGTLLAVVGLVLFLDYQARRDFDIALFAVAGVLIGAGLVVTRLIETYGRPLPVADEDWQTEAAAPGTTWTPDLPESWTPSEPVRERSDRWDDGPWGSSR